MTILLFVLFFLTALVYSSVGFGGGSTYLALLLLWGVPYEIFPVIALCCNIIVVSGNCFNYARAGNLNFKFLIPYFVGSIPFAFIGGSLPIEKSFFQLMLFAVLTTAGILLLINFKSYDDKEENYRKIPYAVSVSIGSVLGFVSGVVGIGGGIFLSPILFLLRAAKPKHIVTAASKSNTLNAIPEYAYLILAVLIGGQLGNFLNLKILSAKILALITSLLVLFVAIRMGVNIFG